MFATFGQEDGRIYEHKLPAKMDNKYTIYGCDHTRNKEPIAEAKALTRENISNSPVPMTRPREAHLLSSVGFIQPPSRPNDASIFFGKIPISIQTELPPRMGAVALRKKDRDTRTVFHD